ncbi:response regulator transcription factor [Streptomyces sp. B1866]|uniref:response regulator transcription factor n=1 Tax=Streptomyces sp. B1866 TaxID=3075431 RepID=UPI002892175F|nr:response regulator transcription factor [Streptomyces sp. B1866]MDT3398055.1 response regulator transcription factor [Streptomyces sp. B1866]
MSDEETLRILVADDHTLLREALCDLLRLEPGFEIVAQAGNGEDAVRLAAQHRPDVVLLDIEMPRNDPPVTVRRLLQRDPALRIIVLSMYDGRHLVQELLSLGVRGYLHKSTGRETLVTAIRSGDGDRRTVTVSVSPESLREAAPEPEGGGPLSERELEVLGHVAEAMSNRQIAGRLGIAEGTVKRHLRNIFSKLDAVSRIDAVNKATERALLPKQKAAPPAVGHSAPRGL